MSKNNKKKNIKKSNNVFNQKYFTKFDLKQKEIKMISTIQNMENNKKLQITISKLGPEKNYRIPLLIEINNIHINFIEQYRFNLDTYGLPHSKLYDIEFKDPLYMPFNQIVKGKNKCTYNIILGINVKYKMKDINPIYMNQIDKQINPARHWILRLEEPFETDKYHKLFYIKKDLYPKDYEDRNLNPYHVVYKADEEFKKLENNPKKNNNIIYLDNQADNKKSNDKSNELICEHHNKQLIANHVEPIIEQTDEPIIEQTGESIIENDNIVKQSSGVELEKALERLKLSFNNKNVFLKLPSI